MQGNEAYLTLRHLSEASDWTIFKWKVVSERLSGLIRYRWQRCAMYRENTKLRQCHKESLVENEWKNVIESNASYVAMNSSANVILY